MIVPDQTQIIHGNALDLPLPDASVDLVVTSPPYFALRSYRDEGDHYSGQVGSEATPQEFLGALWAATAEMKRVLKPTGSIWVNLGDKYAGSGGHNNSGVSRNGTGSTTLTGGKKKLEALAEAGGATRRNAPDRYNQNSGGIPAKSLMGLPWRYAIGCVDQLGLILRAEVIWSKPNGLPESVTDRVRRSHEVFFHFTKQGRYFSAVDEIREEGTGRKQSGGPWLERNEGNVLGRATNPHCGLAGYEPNPLGKLPGSVWTIPSEPLIIPEAIQQHYNLPDHFAAFPQEWPRRIILGWSPSGICTKCGEGRRPVVVSEKVTSRPGINIRDQRMPGRHASGNQGREGRAGDYETTMSGYACACDVPIAPTRPAVVLDPFAGTGTVPMVARALGRIGIGVELSRDYVRLANWRVFQSGQGKKAERRTDAERQTSLSGMWDTDLGGSDVLHSLSVQGEPESDLREASAAARQGRDIGGAERGARTATPAGATVNGESGEGRGEPSAPETGVLRPLWPEDEAGLAPHRREPDEQHPIQPGGAVSAMPSDRGRSARIPQERNAEDGQSGAAQGGVTV